MPAAIGYRNFFEGTLLAGAQVATDSSAFGTPDASYPSSNVFDGRRSTYWRRQTCAPRSTSPTSCAQLDLYALLRDYSGLLTGSGVIKPLPVALLHLDNVSVNLQSAHPDGQRVNFGIRVTASHTAYTSNTLYDSGDMTFTADQFGAQPSVVVPIGFPTTLTAGQRLERQLAGGYVASGGSSNLNLYIRVKIWATAAMPTYSPTFSVHVGSVRLASALCFDVSESGFSPGVVDNTNVIRTHGQTAVANAKTPARRVSGTMVGLKDDQVMGQHSTIVKFNREAGLSQRVFFTPSVFSDETSPPIWSSNKSMALHALSLLEQPLSPSTVARTDSGDSSDGSKNGFVWVCPFSLLETVD